MGNGKRSQPATTINTWVCSDLHLGHKNVLKFCEGQPYNGRGFAKTIEQHDEHIFRKWDMTINKRDKIFILGDVAMCRNQLARIKEMPGQKHLVMGNHDEFTLDRYFDVFQKIDGITKYDKAWLTHAPIHPFELRGKPNVHGHTHYAQMPGKNERSFLVINHDLTIARRREKIDPRYINVSVELTAGDIFLNWERDIRPLLAKGRQYV